MALRYVIVDAVEDRRDGIDLRIRKEIAPRLDVDLHRHDRQVVVLKEKEKEPEMKIRAYGSVGIILPDDEETFDGKAVPDW